MQSSTFWHSCTHLLPRQEQETQGITLRSESLWQLFSSGCNLTLSHTNNHHSDIWTLKSLFPEAHEALLWSFGKEESIGSGIAQVQTQKWSSEVAELGFTSENTLLRACNGKRSSTYWHSTLRHKKLNEITRSKTSTEGCLFICKPGSPSFRVYISINLHMKVT